MPELGTPERPLRVAIVGSGPSGFFAADSLLKAKVICRVDMFERLPTPYGLVRSGVAPDHMKIRVITRPFEKIARHERFRFFGHVDVGIDVSMNTLRAYYDAVIFACGSETNLRLGITGEELPGSHTAGAFVGWYNGHPICRHLNFDLTQEAAVVIGVGNVAVDVARMLARTVDELKHTDISQNALDVLAESKVKEIFLIGRRSAAQAKFRDIELREMGEMADCNCIVHPEEVALNPESEAELEDAAVRRTMAKLREYAALAPDPAKHKRIHLRFMRSPVKILGKTQVEAIILEKTKLRGAPGRQEAVGTGEIEVLPCGLVFSSIGYRGTPIPGVPFDRQRSIIPNIEGRVTDQGRVLPGLYAVGWIKRGPSGLIGNNKPDSHATVDKIIEDLPNLAPCAIPDSDALERMLVEKVKYVVSFNDWLKIDAAEIDRGRPVGKPRERFTRISQMLAVLDR
jgi:ferredoxin--NADP+ reductase